MARPLISVIIPTYGPRTVLLSRAIKSAIDGLPREDVEIILVPNGAGTDWREACSEHFGTCKLVVVEQEQADRNIARARGLSVARGRYIRFLDDDDYLIPSQATKQYEELLSDLTLDVCSSPISIVDVNGDILKTRTLPNTTDFVTSVLAPDRIPLFIAHVFKAETAKSTGMPLVQRAEDAVFLLRMCRLREIRWASLMRPAASWYQHPFGSRTSSSIGFKIGRKIIATELLDLFHHLQGQGRLTPERRGAVTDALWDCVHRGFPHHPWYWSRVGRTVLQTFPGSTPRHLPKALSLGGYLNPLVGEWALVPFWQMVLFYRSLKSHLSGEDYKRVV